MSTATTNKPLNLYQLGQEIGGNPALRAVGPDADGATQVRAEGVSQATLDAKIAAHTADPNVKPPPSAQETEDASVSAFIAARLPTVLDKARAIMANPGSAPDFTATERKVMDAANILDLAQRRR